MRTRTGIPLCISQAWITAAATFLESVAASANLIPAQIGMKSLDLSALRGVGGGGGAHRDGLWLVGG